MTETKTRGRKQVISKETIFQNLNDKEWHSKSDLAEQNEVCRATISARVRDLIKDGHAILVGLDGYKLVKPEDITDEDAAQAVEAMTHWMLGVVTRQAMSAKPMKRLMVEARKLLPRSTEERLIVRKYLVQLTHLIDFQEADDLGA